jgi:hypothetical protein
MRLGLKEYLSRTPVSELVQMEKMNPKAPKL